MASDTDRLATLVAVWKEAADDAVTLLRSLEPEEWALPTDLPGWDVRAVAAHLAHLESTLAGHPQETVDVPPADHIHGMMGQFTEAGPLARAGWETSRIVDELETSVAERYAALQADPPADPAATAPGFAALLGWSWETLLSNRPLDVWMHDQDIRRATNRPGGLDGAVAGHVADVFARSLPYVVAKRAGAPPGATVVLDVTGPHARRLVAAVGEDGRGRALETAPAEPTSAIRTDFESWIVLAGGRRAPADVDVEVTGDEDLARRVLARMAVTP